jgi:hypothetical protein
MVIKTDERKLVCPISTIGIVNHRCSGINGIPVELISQNRPTFDKLKMEEPILSVLAVVLYDKNPPAFTV